ncbi:MAG: hypothetical protein K2J08_07340, partial [Ruminococcus sp.]|nr:hypothetical protein [Ruminococcus sp.]
MKNSLFKRAMATVAAVPLALTQCLTYSSSYAATNETQTSAEDYTVSTQADVKTYTLQGEGGLLYIPEDMEVSEWYVTFHKQLVNMGQEHTKNYIKKSDIESQVLAHAGAYRETAQMALDLIDGDIECIVEGNGNIKLIGNVKNPTSTDYSKFMGSIEIPALKALEEVFEKYEVPQEKIDDLMKNPNTEDIKEIIKEYDIDVDEVAEAFGMTPEELAEKYGISKEQLEEIQKSGPIIQSAPRANDESESGGALFDFSKLEAVDVSGTFEIVIKTSELDDNEGENIGITFKYIANNNGNIKELAVGELPAFAVEKFTELKDTAKEVIYDAISDEKMAEDTFKNIETKIDKFIKMVEKADSYKGKVKEIKRHAGPFGRMANLLEKAGDFADKNSYVGKVENKLNKNFKVPSSVAEIMSKSIVATAYDTILNNINSSLPAFDFQISSGDIAQFADEELRNIEADANAGTYILTADFPDKEIEDSMKHLKASVAVENIDSASEDLAKVGLRIWRDPVTTTTTSTTETTTQTTTTTTLTTPSSTDDTDSTTSTTPSSTDDTDSTTSTTDDPSSTTTATDDTDSTTTTLVTDDPSSTTATDDTDSTTTTATDDLSSTTATDDTDSTTTTLVTDDPSSTT